MSVVPQKRLYKLEEYLDLEKVSPDKHEFYRGEIFLMAGASIRHGIINGNLYHHLRLQLKGQPCQPYISDQRVAVRKYPLHTYPDVSVVCGKPITDPVDRHAIINPQFLFETLSPSTEKYDRGKKFEFYQAIETLQGYILVAQDRPHVDRYLRQPNGDWLRTSYDGLEAVLELPELGCRLALADIYEGVEFGEEESEGESS
jgi:Uma2 family endonuclease